MTMYVSFRAHSVGGAVVDPYVLEGDGTASPPILHFLDWPSVTARITGKNVLFGVHGFNVSYEHGARSLGQLEPQLGLRNSDLYLGVLWPGDFWLPVVNYPFEGAVSIDCGRRLAACCSRWFASAQSLCFVSHSLGARLVLEAVQNLSRPARVVCLAAAAINEDCLTTEYADAAKNTEEISILASRKDDVLKIAFRIGDPISDLLHDDHRPFEQALGYDGPPAPALPPVVAPWQIPDALGYGHGDYLPPGDAVQDAQAVAKAKWLRAASFMSRAFHSQAQSWP
jgi:alpha/beta hydrolase family protein DUF900